MHRISGIVCAVVGSLVVAFFLAPPAAAATPGTVVGTELLDPSRLPWGASSGERILYDTRDQNGRPARSYGAVYYPSGKAPAGGWKVVSWAHGTSGIAEKCAPSRAPGTDRDRLEPTIRAALAAGYVVVASDYIGLGGGDRAQYLGGRSEAHSVLDMIRAARRKDPRISKDWVSVGHSQGGHAALWAAWLARRYAPDLSLHGTVALAPASHTEVMFAGFGPQLPSLPALDGLGGLALYALTGLDTARGDLHVLNYLTPTGRRLARRVESLCVFDLAPIFASTPLRALFARPLADPAMIAALRDYMAIPTSGWTTPVRVEQGSADEVVLAPLTGALVAELAAGGARVSQVTYPGADHMQVVPRSIPDTLATIAKFFR